MVQHCGTLNRSVQVVNLDPAAEYFNYPVMAGESYRIQIHGPQNPPVSGQKNNHPVRNVINSNVKIVLEFGLHKTFD